jgi:hypothetical protein
MVWEAADRICGKRLYYQVITGLIEAIERHRHLSLDPTVKESLLSMSPATMDQLLAVVWDNRQTGPPQVEHQQHGAAEKYSRANLWRLE